MEGDDPEGNQVSRPEDEGEASLVESGDELPPTRGQRVGYGFAGVVMIGLGVWIVPFQAARGEIWKLAIGVGLAVVGGLMLYRAIRARSIKEIEAVTKLLDVVS